MNIFNALIKPARNTRRIIFFNPLKFLVLKVLFSLALFFSSFEFLQAQVSMLWNRRYSTAHSDQPVVLRTDPGGNAYVLGLTSSVNTATIVIMKYNAAGTLLWNVNYNTPNNLQDVGTDLIIDRTGNVYVTGFTQYRTTNGGTSSEALILKLNSSGVQQWVKTYRRSDQNPTAASGVAVDASGNVFIAGYGLTAPFHYDYLTIKFNSVGVLQWVRSLDGIKKGLDQAKHIGLDGSGNVYVFGNSEGQIIGRPLNKKVIIPTGYDYLLVKYDPNGNELWQQRYNVNNRNESTADMKVLSDGTVYVTGETSLGIDRFDYLTIKYASDGSRQWVNTYSGSFAGRHRATAIDVHQSGDVFVTGIEEVSFNAFDYATIKYNSAGAQQWVSKYNSPTNGWDFARDIVVDPFGSVYVTGESDKDILTVCYRSNGVQDWALRYNLDPGTSNDNYGKAIALYVDDGPQFLLPDVYVVGAGNNPATLSDIELIKYEQFLVVGEKTVKEDAPSSLAYTATLSIAPNPVRGTGKVLFEIAEASQVSIELYDLQGRKVRSIFSGKVPGGRHSVPIAVNGLSKGSYTCRMVATNGPAVVKKSSPVVVEY